MIVCLRQEQNPDLSPNLCTWAWGCLVNLKLLHAYELWLWNAQNPFFPPKTWRKSRKLVRSFSKILCTWVDFVTWTSWVFIFVHSKDTQTHSEWRDYSYSRNAHICSFGIQRSLLNSLLLLTTYHTGICIQAILTCLGYKSVNPMGSDFLHLEVSTISSSLMKEKIHKY